MYVYVYFISSLRQHNWVKPSQGCSPPLVIGSYAAFDPDKERVAWGLPPKVYYKEVHKFSTCPFSGEFDWNVNVRFMKFGKMECGEFKALVDMAKTMSV